MPPEPQESIFSQEKTEQCDLPIVPPIPELPEIAECDMGPIPTPPPPLTTVPPEDGKDGVDGIIHSVLVRSVTEFMREYTAVDLLWREFEHLIFSSML